MPAIAVDRHRRVPLLAQLHAAMRAAAEQGIAVAPDRPGVICISRHPHTWVQDPTSPTVCPIGALILDKQPPTADLQRAECMVLDDAGPIFVAGVEDGLSAAEPCIEIVNSTRRELYRLGMELGGWLRAEMVAKRCAQHGRFPADEPTCTACFESEAQYDLEVLH